MYTINKYSASDCVELYRMGVPLHGRVSFYDQVIERLKRLTCDDMPTDEMVTDVLFTYFDHRRYPAVNTFIFYVPFDDVPLYINVPEMQLYVKWRLKICK